MVGKAQLVAAAPGIDDPVFIEIEEVGIVVPIVCLAPPVSLLLIHQLPCVFAQQIALVGLLLCTRSSPQHNVQVAYDRFCCSLLM